MSDNPDTPIEIEAEDPPVPAQTDPLETGKPETDTPAVQTDLDAVKTKTPPAAPPQPSHRGTGSQPDSHTELPQSEIACHDSDQINRSLEALATGRAVLR